MHVLAEKTYTPEDLLSMPDGKNYELVDGHLVERKMSQLSSWVGGRLHRILDEHVEENRLGWTWHADLGFDCFPHPSGKVRRPDVSFIRIERMPDGPTSEGYSHIPPDFAAEVISPNDLWHDVMSKVAEYLAFGVSLVWVIDPESRIAFVHRPGAMIQQLSEADELSGEDVIPGFRCPLASIFPRKPEPQAAVPPAPAE
jgi:Uma2 family endonuclease